VFISKGVHTSNQVFISKEEQEEEEEGLFKADAVFISKGVHTNNKVFKVRVYTQVIRCSLVRVYTQIIRCSSKGVHTNPGPLCLRAYSAHT